jgi:tRNA-dihydrouridine synthase
LSADLAAITVHARTVKEQSLVPARWQHVKEAVALRDASRKDTLIIGNGDVRDMPHGRMLAEETGADGIMIGRGVFGNPWVFNIRRRSAPSRQEKLDALVALARLFERLLGGRKNYAIMKKHFKAYVSGFDGAKELRVALMEGGNSAKEVERIIKGHIQRG